MSWNLADLFEGHADRFPDRLAVVSGDIELTYGQLDDRATRLANHMKSRGVGAGSHIGLYLYNRHEYLEAMLGAFKARLVPINVNYRFVEAELVRVLRDANARALVYHARFAPRLPPLVHLHVDLAPHQIGGLVVVVVRQVAEELLRVAGELVEVVLRQVGLRLALLLRPHARGADVGTGGEPRGATTQTGDIVDRRRGVEVFRPVHG